MTTRGKYLATSLVLSWLLTDLRCSPNLTLRDLPVPLIYSKPHYCMSAIDEVGGEACEMVPDKKPGIWGRNDGVGVGKRACFTLANAKRE